MKKLFIALLCLVLVGCSSSETPTSTATSESTPEPTETVATQKEPQLLYEFSGTGDDVVEMSVDGATILDITNNSDGHFSVTAHGDSDDLLANEIYPYEGRRLLNMAGDITLEVQSDGEWTINVYDHPGYADSDSFSGSGDFVTPVAVSTSKTYHITSNSDGYFYVAIYGESGGDMLVNEIEPYEGDVYADFEGENVLFEIECDGNWSIEPIK